MELRQPRSYGSAPDILHSHYSSGRNGIAERWIKSKNHQPRAGLSRTRNRHECLDLESGFDDSQFECLRPKYRRIETTAARTAGIGWKLAWKRSSDITVDSSAGNF